MEYIKSISFTPEWIQAIAAVVGVIGLLLTLIIQTFTVRIQVKTSALQAEQIFRDKEVQRIKMMPFFTLSVVSWSEEIKAKNITLTLTDNDVNFVMMETGKNIPIKINLNLDFTSFAKAGKQFEYNFEWISEPTNSNKRNLIQLEFADLIGNLYNQTIYSIGKSLFITPPLINHQFLIEALRARQFFYKIKSKFTKPEPRTSIFPED